MAHRGEEHLKERRIVRVQFRHRADQPGQRVRVEALETAQRSHELFRKPVFDDGGTLPPGLVPDAFEVALPLGKQGFGKVCLKLFAHLPLIAGSRGKLHQNGGARSQDLEAGRSGDVAEAHQKLSGGVRGYLGFRRQNCLYFDERRAILHVDRRGLSVVRRGDSPALRIAPLDKTIDEIAEKRRLPAVIVRRSRSPWNEVTEERTERRLKGDRPIRDLPTPAPPFPLVELPGERLN